MKHRRVDVFSARDAAIILGGALGLAILAGAAVGAGVTVLLARRRVR